MQPLFCILKFDATICWKKCIYFAEVKVHSSQGHLRFVLTVLKPFSNFYHQFVSMKGINTLTQE